MDGWMDGRTDGWMDGRTDGWTDGWTDGQRLTDGRMDGWTDGYGGSWGWRGNNAALRPRTWRSHWPVWDSKALGWLYLAFLWYLVGCQAGACRGLCGVH
eukprot:365007-Chlamydomonas_euryale.AAC.3